VREEFYFARTHSAVVLVTGCFHTALFHSSLSAECCRRVGSVIAEL